MAKIMCRVQLGDFPSQQDQEFWFDISPIVSGRIERLDHPSDDAGIMAMLCSNPVRIEQQLSLRKDSAKYISAKLAAEILKAFGSQDAEMGYTKEENDRFRNRGSV